ncbi:MAG TPA: copper-binding protein [Thermoanaerobaculia bacterium]|nr:copper-binding protein [Thermoanaerobaculia bacterium]
MKPFSFAPLIMTLILLTAATGCRREPVEQAQEYPLRGMIVARDDRAVSLTIRHEKIEGYMEAMTMPFPVRGAALDELPPVGAEITATLHVTGRSYWISDVKPK